MKTVELKVFDILAEAHQDTLIIRVRVYEGKRGMAVRWLRFKLPVHASEVLNRARIEFEASKVYLQENMLIPTTDGVWY